MNTQEALSILDIQQNATQEDIKKAYRKAAAKYHPDHNPAGLEMMKMVNIAYDVLKTWDGKFKEEDKYAKNYSEKINEALNSIINLGLNIEICGSWVWVSGNTKQRKGELKKAGFLWSAKKMMWYFRPSSKKSYRSKGSWSIDKIRNSFGSSEVKGVSILKPLLA